MSETENTETATGPYGVTLYINEDGHLVFENNSEFGVNYTIDKTSSSETYGHLLVSYSTKI